MINNIVLGIGGFTDLQIAFLIALLIMLAVTLAYLTYSYFCILTGRHYFKYLKRRTGTIQSKSKRLAKEQEIINRRINELYLLKNLMNDTLSYERAQIIKAKKNIEKLTIETKELEMQLKSCLEKLLETDDEALCDTKTEKKARRENG